MKRVLTAALCAAALAVTASTEPPAQTRRPNQDEIDLMKLARIYERAINEQNVELLIPFMEAGFEGMSVTGTRISKPDELRALWKRVQELMKKGGPNGRYKVQVKPKSIEVRGDEAKVTGETDEEFVTGDGKVLKYQLQFDTQFKKGPDGWRMKGLQTRANLLDKVTMAARMVAIDLWRPRLQLKDPNAAPPDWDLDRGANDKDVAASVGGAPAAPQAAPAAAAAKPAVRRNAPPPPPMTHPAVQRPESPLGRTVR
ncbi:MAG: nuclear transport factor 2 family protein [Elusimicrobia bacterium]|nr:nuclear transport factor 2 family protein [Elusimicrobiota bacterium]